MASAWRGSWGAPPSIILHACLKPVLSKPLVVLPYWSVRWPLAPGWDFNSRLHPHKVWLINCIISFTDWGSGPFSLWAFKYETDLQTSFDTSWVCGTKKKGRKNSHMHVDILWVFKARPLSWPGWSRDFVGWNRDLVVETVIWWLKQWFARNLPCRSSAVLVVKWRQLSVHISDRIPYNLTSHFLTDDYGTCARGRAVCVWVFFLFRVFFLTGTFMELFFKTKYPCTPETIFF